MSEAETSEQWGHYEKPTEDIVDWRPSQQDGTVPSGIPVQHQPSSDVPHLTSSTSPHIPYLTYLTSLSPLTSPTSSHLPQLTLSPPSPHLTYLTPSPHLTSPYLPHPLTSPHLTPLTLPTSPPNLTYLTSLTSPIHFTSCSEAYLLVLQVGVSQGLIAPYPKIKGLQKVRNQTQT